jgi:hypothetical protein
MTEPEVSCIGCGCTDEETCLEGCYWLRLDETAGAGVCSSCPDEVDQFDAGEHAGECFERDAGELEDLACELHHAFPICSSRCDWAAEHLRNAVADLIGVRA